MSPGQGHSPAVQLDPIKGVIRPGMLGSDDRHIGHQRGGGHLRAQSTRCYDDRGRGYDGSDGKWERGAHAY